MEKLEVLGRKDRGYFYALPGLILGIFHMIVAYAVLGAGDGFKNGDFIPGLFEILIGIALYGGLFCCVIMAIFKKKCSAVFEFIGIVTLGRLLLPVFGMIGGAFVISFVILGIALMGFSLLFAGLFSALLIPFLGTVLGVHFAAKGALALLFPVMGVIVVIAIIVGMITGALEGAGFMGRLFSEVIPLL